MAQSKSSLYNKKELSLERPLAFCLSIDSMEQIQLPFVFVRVSVCSLVGALCQYCVKSLQHKHKKSSSE